MDIVSQIKGLSAPALINPTGGAKATSLGTEGSFANFLTQAASQLEQLQGEADVSIEKLATGEDIDIHEVMIAVEKASLALELTLQVRNKLVEAYQEIMRIQV